MADTHPKHGTKEYSDEARESIQRALDVTPDAPAQQEPMRDGHRTIGWSDKLMNIFDRSEAGTHRAKLMRERGLGGDMPSEEEVQASLEADRAEWARKNPKK